MRMLVAAVALSGVGILLAAGACTGVTQPQDISFPDSAVSYVRHMQPFLNLSCANGGCHDNSDPSAGIRLTDYTGLMFSRGNLVVPSRPDESLLIQSLEQIIPHPYDIMSRVTENQRRGVRTWILEGALFN